METQIRESLFLSEIWVERVTHEQKIAFSLLVAESKTSEKESSLHAEMHSLINKLEDMFLALNNFIGIK